MIRKILTCVLIVPLVFSVSFPSSSFADNEKKEKEEKLEKIRTEKKKQKSELKQVQENLQKSKTELSKIENNIEKYDKKIEQLNKSLNQNQKELNKQKEQVHNMIRRLYVQGDTRYMAEILTADSFSEFLLRFETLRMIVKRETNLLTSFQNTKEKIEKARKDIEESKKKQEPLLKVAEKKYIQIKSLYSKENQELAKLEKEEEATLKDIQELDKNAKDAANKFNNNLGSGILGFPTTRGPVYWNYGQNRGSHIHAGIDIPRPIGTPLYAADSGVVSLTKSNPGGYGYYIIINHGNGLSTLYAHMYRNTVTVSVGQKVRKGQLIARVGNNGRSSGPHLHFEVRKNGNPVNPRNYLN